MNKLCSEGPGPPPLLKTHSLNKDDLAVHLAANFVPSSYIIGSTCSHELTKLSCFVVSVAQVPQAKQNTRTENSIPGQAVEQGIQIFEKKI